MTWYQIILFIITLLVMLTGLVGTLLPVIPGTPLILGAALLYAFIEGFNSITGNVIGLLAILTGISILLEYLAIVFGIKKMGGTYFGIAGAFIGMIVGLIFWATLASLILGPLIGAVLFEMLIGKRAHEAFKAGLGSFIGFIVGGALKFAIAATMIGIFTWNALFR